MVMLVVVANHAVTLQTLSTGQDATADNGLRESEKRRTQITHSLADFDLVGDPSFQILGASEMSFNLALDAQDME